jgi:hypothetical protein
MTDSLPPDHSRPRPGYAGAEGATTYGDDLVLLLSIFEAVMRRKVFVLAWALALGSTGGAIAFLSPKTWTTSASLIAVNRRSPGATGNLGGLAAQFGVSIPGGEPMQSPAFFVDLVQTAEVMLPVLYAPTGGRIVLDAIETPAADSAVRAQLGLQRLRTLVQAGASPRTGMLTISASTKHARLSYDIVRTLVQSLDRAYGMSRRSQATSERRFAEVRLSEVRGLLESAEENQRTFLQANRTYLNSPELRLRYQRLERETGLQQALFQTLSQSVEQARIEEARDTPALSVVDRPREAAVRDRRGALAKTGIGLLVGLVIGLLWVLSAELRSRFRANRARGV